MSQRVIDLFAGPGGWDVAARRLGFDPLGIEWDDAACATREAAGLRTLQADVAALRPEDVLGSLGWDELDGLIASPPCQAYSMAGKGAGRRDVEHVVACAHEMARGWDTRAAHRAKCEDERSVLVVEALRWADRLRPRWIAFEQVPPVLELWNLFAHLLERECGYATWTGILGAERYGVPQTRERAILIAHRDRHVEPPRPTHQRYVPGEPQRHDVTFDGEVLPWVSMAEALGWGMTERPSMTFAPGTGSGGPEAVGGSGARRTVEREREREARGFRLARGEGMSDRHGERRATPENEPAPTITSKARTAEWVLVNGTQQNAARRGGAPTRPNRPLRARDE